MLSLEKLKKIWGINSGDGIILPQKFLFLTSPYLSKIFFGKTFYLRSICLMLTSKCNLRCRICGFWGEKGFVNYVEENLSIKDYKNVIDDLAIFKSSLIFSGGEPLLNKDWYELARHAKSKKLHLILQTNGTYLKENSEKIIETIDDLSISIDGTEEIHNRIRGEGTYQKVIEGMREISEFKKKKNLKKPLIDINFTIQELNHNYLIETVEELSRTNIGIRGITLMHLMFFDEKIFQEHLNKFSKNFNIGNLAKGFLFKIENLDVEELIKQINYLKNNSQKFNIDIIFTPDLTDEKIRRYYDLKDFENAGKLQGKCYTPYLEAMIFPEILELLDKNALIITENITVDNLIHYFRWVGKKREDMTVVCTEYLSFPWYLENLRRKGIYIPEALFKYSRDNIIYNDKRDAFVAKTIFLENKKYPAYLIFSESKAQKIFPDTFSSYKQKYITKITEYQNEKIIKPFISVVKKIER